MVAPSVVSRIAHESCLDSEPYLSKTPWWEHLDEGFAYRPESFDLAFGDRLRVGATSMFDIGLRTGVASVISGLTIPSGYNPVELRRTFENADVYHDIAASRDPSRFFKAPPKGVQIDVDARPRYAYFSPDDGICEILRFESPFQPVNPSQRKSYLRHKQNRTAHARYWRHNDGPRPTIMAIHGFTADFYLINEWFFALPWFYRMGCDVLLYTLPFHGSRQTRFSPFSGHGYFAGGPSRVNEAAAQSVFDFRIFVDWLERERGVQTLGVTGVSLGGFTSALLAAVEPRLHFVIPNVPVISLADIVLEWQPIGALLQLALKTASMTIKDIRHLLAVSCPLTWEPQVPRERRMIIAGVGDRLAPPKHSRILWEHWQRNRIHWFPGSHLLHLDRGHYLRQIWRFLLEIGFLPDDARYPEVRQL